MGFAGQFGGGMLFPETLNTPLLKASLSVALGKMPVYSGRLCFAKDGRLNVHCNRAGARFVTASTSATLADVKAALASRSAHVVSNPWKPFWPPHDVDALVRDQWPLAAGFVLHLSGGGSVLWVAAHHCCADFESLQTLAAHWAAAYNAALATAARTPGPAFPGYDAALPVDRRNPSMSPQHCEALAGSRGTQGSTAGALASAVLAERPAPPRREIAEASWWSGVVVTAYAMYHLVWRGGGTEMRRYHVSSERLAELKAQANAELQAEGERRNSDGTQQPGQQPRQRHAEEARHAATGSCSSPAASSEASSAWDLAEVPWVSTNDALVGRLLQVLHSLPLRRSSRLDCFVSADMRRRASPPLPPARLGNMLYSAHLADLEPSSTSLGRLAGSLRYTLTHHLVPQFRGCMERTAAALARVGPRRLVFAFCLEREARRNIFAPEGPVNLTNWDVQFGLWQFGPSPPLAFLPLAEIGPCVVLLHPAGPDRRDGITLVASMHRATWRQLDATGRDLGSLL